VSATKPPRGPRIGLTLKIFGTTALVVVAVLAGVLALTSLRARQTAEATLDRQLRNAGQVVRAFLVSEQAKLASGLAAAVQNPNYVANLTSGEPGAAIDQADTFAEQLGADYVQILDATGIQRARSDDHGADSVDFSGSPLVRPGLEGQTATGLTIAGAAPELKMFLLVSAPMRQGVTGAIQAVVVAAHQVTDSLAREIEAATGSAVVFYSKEEGGAVVVAASVPRGAALDQVLARIDRAAMDSVGEATRSSVHAEWQGSRMVGMNQTLANRGSSSALGGYLVLRSLDAELAPFRQLQRTLLIVGGVGLLLALLVSFAVAHRITRPVRALARAANSVAEGDYNTAIPATSRDEIGELAASFRHMLEELKAKQQLVEYLSGSAASAATQVIPSSATSLSQAPTMVRAAAAQTPSIQPGQTFAGRYEVKAILGMGGMGVVYRAVDKELGEPVAIKTLKNDAMASDPALLQRFKDEIRLARKITHRNVVRTHDIGEVDGMYYITMEFAEGQSLKSLITTRGSLPVPVVLTVGKQLCRALEAAHEQGVIHRDIKPQNLVVEPSGTLKVMDFGIARLATRTDGVTQAGMAIGTPEYMAPEQLLGDDVDFRADIYAAGCVLFECLTGRPPFVADSPITLVAKQLEEMPPSPASLNAEVPASLADLVLRALSKDRASRPANAAALHDELDAITV
jgi:eukaryotic-like serine/threonine-protein kinase